MKVMFKNQFPCFSCGLYCVSISCIYYLELNLFHGVRFIQSLVKELFISLNTEAYLQNFHCPLPAGF
jgi:hypothetical protein